MNVKKLIEELKQYDENAEVLMYKGNGVMKVVKCDDIEYDELTNELIVVSSQ